MKLFDYCHYEDFGDEWYFQLLSIPNKFALIDMRIQWDEFPARDLLPSLTIGIGPLDIGFSFRWRKFELHFDVLDFNPRNLNHYRAGRTVYYKMKNPNIGLSQ